MPRKKKQPIKRQRHTPYERALQRANARLTKAIIERDACAERLKNLTIEIPRLQDMIAGIERFMGVTRIQKEGPMPPPNGLPFVSAPTGMVEHTYNPETVPKDLTVDELPDEDDALLPDVAGKELLP